MINFAAILLSLLLFAPTNSSRPAWVDASPGLHGGVYETKVIVGPEVTRAECEAKLGPVVEQAARDYAARTFGELPEGTFDTRWEMLKARVVGEMWDEHLDAGSGESTFLHVQLKFDDALRSMWQHAADRWTTTTRTGNVLSGFGIGMGLVLVVHVALRVTASSTKPI